MAKHLNIVGVVQGVGYRAAFADQAQALRLSGWVRNRMDGSVEAIVAGEKEALDKMIAWAWQGPAAAQVRAVAVADAGEGSTISRKFEILPTK